MESIRAPRGTKDILPKESWKWAYVLNVSRQTAEDYGYKEIHLPIFEHTELFSRGIGDTTDIVEKEMYTFQDRSGRSLTLRPELTASMVRSYVEHGLKNSPQPVKLWSVGPMFRYERPQKGRYRQFWQLDIEALGSANPWVDVEIIDFSLELYRRLGLSNLEVVVNSVGCPICRPHYRSALREFLAPRLDSLCETCRDRYDRNPLRILDCKNPECRELTEEAPEITEYLCPECRSHFDELLKGLSDIGAKVLRDKRLVRGLDYYTKTAYEVLSGDLGAQNAVCGGGRYDNLAEAIGGPHVPGVGFASGIDRVILTMESQGCSFGREPAVRVFVVAAEEGSREEAYRLLHELRAAGISADADYEERNLKGQLKAASAGKAEYACLLGESEVRQGKVALKHLKSGKQIDVTREELLLRLKEETEGIERA